MRKNENIKENEVTITEQELKQNIPIDITFLKIRADWNARVPQVKSISIELAVVSSNFNCKMRLKKVLT